MQKSGAVLFSSRIPANYQWSECNAKNDDTNKPGLMNELFSLLAFAAVMSGPGMGSDRPVSPVVEPEIPWEQRVCHRLDKLDEFMYIYAKKCPIDRPFSFYELVFDPNGDIRYRCEDAGPPHLEENTVHLLNSTTLISMANAPYKDKYRRSWCMLALFYSPNCVFSQRIAPAFNAVPKNFDNIRVIAMDATHFSRMNTRYGIAGTPTVVLWVKGIPVARMEERSLDAKGIADFLSEWTDLESHKLSEGEDGPLVIEPSNRRDYVLTLYAICVLIIGFVYASRERILSLPAVEAILEKMGTSSGHAIWYLNGM